MASKKHITTRVFCKVTQKMVDKGDELHEGNSGPMIIPPLEPFLSPITGEEITSRDQLKRHNKAHGVTNAQDYSQSWYEAKQKENHLRATGQDEGSRRERIEAIREALHRR